MQHTDIHTLGLPPIDQIGFVVRDLDAAIERYAPMFGPFSTMDGPVEAADFRGASRDVELKLAFGHTGEVEIELIQWLSGSSPHSEFIQAGREGIHHIRFNVGDCDAWIERVAAIGYAPIWYKYLVEREMKFAYLERADDPLLIEFIQMP